MKKHLLPAAVALTLIVGSCTKNAETPQAIAQAPTEKVATYGDTITAEGAITAEKLPSLLASQDSAKAKVATNVLEVCQAKGCWMKVAVEGQEPMRVTFKNYGFFMPKDIVGKEVVFEGVALKDTISVEDQRHFAEDAGKSKEEIAAITKPKPSITFVASGVQVKEGEAKDN
ncbi:DUF4920 domain-containing protein [Rufibacter tibetensis]|uniref:DUF4920 domain-containing protein n=1 Tax=Rufibacter tibetensis TaxID=512763 RepID=A0A0N7HWW6_9BACT|nr:DUF4920 domain-containing protein [Rufibacter tibetensis]ALJ00393.1 hypothetical protein DC20_17210 [Rufibacter tibetensis]